MTNPIRVHPSVPSHPLVEVASNRDHQVASTSHSTAEVHPSQIAPRNSEPRMHHRGAMQMALLAQVPQLGKSDYFRQWDAWAQASGTSGEDRAEAVTRMKEWLNNHQPHEILSLNCLGLSSLPKLPHSLKNLDVSGNELTSLPEYLPDSLESLDVSDNQLTRLPQHLPDSLQDLGVSDNQLTSLPEHLPKSLKSLYASDNQLTSLPQHLPESLQNLSVSNNLLTSLPANLPKSLHSLSAFGNKLSSLPTDMTSRLGQSCVVDVSNNPLQETVRKKLQEAINASDYHGPQVYFSAAPTSPGASSHASDDAVWSLYGDFNRKPVRKTWTDETAAEKIQAVWRGAAVRRNMAAQTQQSTPYHSPLQLQQATHGFSLKNLKDRPVGSAQRKAEYEVYSSTNKIAAEGQAFLHSFQRVDALKSALQSYSSSGNSGVESIYSPKNAGARQHDMKLNSIWLLGLAHHAKKAVLTTRLDDETLVRQSAQAKPVEQRNTEHNFSALGREVLGMVQNGHFVPRYDERHGFQVLIPTPQARLATLEDFKTPSGMKKEEIKEKLAASGIDVSRITTSS